jgi:hypothetical protein
MRKDPLSKSATAPSSLVVSEDVDIPLFLQKGARHCRSGGASAYDGNLQHKERRFFRVSPNDRLGSSEGKNATYCSLGSLLPSAYLQ